MEHLRFLPELHYPRMDELLGMYLLDAQKDHNVNFPTLAEGKRLIKFALEPTSSENENRKFYIVNAYSMPMSPLIPDDFVMKYYIEKNEKTGEKIRPLTLTDEELVVSQEVYIVSNDGRIYFPDKNRMLDEGEKQDLIDDVSRMEVARQIPDWMNFQYQ